MMTNYCLNVQSCYSMLSSLITIDNYIAYGKANNIATLSLIDFNVMHGAYEFYKKCLLAGIKPIIGVSLVLHYAENVSLKCALIAYNEQGYQNLIKVSSLLMIEKSKQISFDMLQPYLKDVAMIVNPVQANRLELSKSFNGADLYFGFDESNLGLYVEFNAGFSSLTNKCLWFNNVNYFNESDKDSYRLLIAIRRQVSYLEVPDLGCHDFWALQDQIPETMVENNRLLMERCNVVISKQDFKQTLLRYPTPNGISSKAYLAGLCQEGWLSRFSQKFDVAKQMIYRQRLDYELDVINRMGFNDYFLIVYDYVNRARELNIYVGPGRGSAAGSLVSYLLHITEVDPIAYDLLFERFLNPERKSMPDIDIDFEDTNRDKIVEYLFEKYKALHVAHIVTYQTIGLKMALRDLCRATGVDVGEADKMSKLVDARYNFDLSQALLNSKQLMLYQQKYDFIFKHISNFVGLPRQTGTHAAGVVLSQAPLSDIVPIQEGYNGIYQTQYSMEHLEELGLIKFDLLGLRNLSLLHMIVDDVSRNLKRKLPVSAIPLDDAKTFTLLQSGATSGLFQLESPGMTEVLVKMKASSLLDIAATSSLFRPGPQENIPLYIARKEGKEPVNYLDERMRDILSSTYGIIVYQEQVMLIAQRVAGFSLAKADILRRAMSKKDYATMDSARDEFMLGAQRNGYSLSNSQAIWNLIDKFASYGFNKSHAICYSLIGYWMAYFKANYPSSFFSSLLTSVIGSEEKTSMYLQEARRNNLQVVPPCINRVNQTYYGEDDTIYMPLLVIKQIGFAFFKQIANDVNENKKFSSLFEVFMRLFKKGLSKKTYEALCFAGALDVFGFNRTSAFANYDTLIRYIDVISYRRDGQLFLDQSMTQQPILKHVDDDEIEIINKEHEFLGFYLHTHPIAYLRTYFHLESRTQLVTDLTLNMKVANVIGQIMRVKVIHDKKDQQMAFIDIIDESGEISITCFADTYQDCREILLANNVVLAQIRLETYKEKIKGVLLRIKKLEREE